MKPITVGACGWVGARAVVCPGVTVGEGAVASAGAVVVRDIPRFEVHAGNPAGLVKMRTVRGAKEAD